MKVAVSTFHGEIVDQLVMRPDGDITYRSMTKVKFGESCAICFAFCCNLLRMNRGK